MIPTTAAKSRIQKFSKTANRGPERSIRREPRRRMRRRPTLSTTRLRNRESNTSPTRVRVMNSPILKPENSRAEKKECNDEEIGTVGKHPAISCEDD